MRSVEEAVLAIDLGTSSVKTLILSRSGVILGRGQASYPTSHPREGFDEQRPDDWLQGIIAAIANARRFAPLVHIHAIAVTGQMHGAVLLDQDRLPLHPAIIWSDQRSAGMLPDIQARLGSGLPSRIGGPLGTGYQALSLAWMRHHRHRLWQEIRYVLLPADYVAFVLTGVIATDASNAVSTGLLDAGSGRWDSDLLNGFGLPAGWLPNVVPSGSEIGTLTPDVATAMELAADVPVIVAGGDAPVAAIGANVVASTDAMILLSTGAQVIRPVHTYTPEPDGRWHTWPAALPAGVSGSPWLSVGATLNAGRAIDWIHRSVAPREALGDVVAQALAVPPGSNRLLYLPFLAGERSPLLDPHARGAFIGLTESHGSHHQVRAVLEGVALSLADTLDRMTGHQEARPAGFVFGGGGASREMRQVMADVIGLPLTIPAVQELSALGAARTAAHTIGWSALDDEPGSLAPAMVVHPNAADSQIYQERLAVYREAVSATLPVMHRLQGLPG